MPNYGEWTDKHINHRAKSWRDIDVPNKGRL